MFEIKNKLINKKWFGNNTIFLNLINKIMIKSNKFTNKMNENKITILIKNF